MLCGCQEGSGQAQPNNKPQKSRRLILVDKSFLFEEEMQCGLVVENLNVDASFLKGTKNIVSNLSFCIERGESLAIVGESGSGKTMTALSLLNLLPDNCEASGNATLNCEAIDVSTQNQEANGCVTLNRETSGVGTSFGIQLLNNKNAKKLRGKEIVYIPHSGVEFLNPSLKIKTQIFESMRLNGMKGRKKMRTDAIEKLQLVGIDDGAQTLEKYPFELSGGQAQRVLIAIAMCAKPTLLIADEATKGVDEKTADDIWKLMLEKFSSACKIFITHNIEFASRCDKVLVIKDGVVQEYGASHEVFQNPQAEYTKLLLKVMPKSR